MKTSIHTHTTSVSRAVFCAGVLTLLSACGGGGNGSASPSAGESNTRSVAGYMTSATVSHPEGAEDQINYIPSVLLEPLEDAFDKVVSLSQYTLNNGLHSMDVDTSTNAEEGIATITEDQKIVKVGGTKWEYSRFGLFQDKQSNSNGQNTEYFLQTIPYALAEPLESATADPAMYNSSGKAVGTVIIGGTIWRNFECDVSVSLSLADNAEIADVELLNCVDAADNNIKYATNSSLMITKILSTDTFSANPALFTATFGAYKMTPSRGYAQFMLGGPKAEEIVGTFYIDGNSDDVQTYTTLAFGAKK